MLQGQGMVWKTKTNFRWNNLRNAQKNPQITEKELWKQTQV